MNKTKKIAISGLLVALAVVCSAFYIPVGAAKCFPAQHAVNIIASVILGPWYSLGIAFVTSLIRVLTGTGSLLAFPGSMIGAFLSGMAYKYSKKLLMAYLGEIIGTGVIGAIASYPIATLVLAKEAAIFGFIIPFTVSSFGGATISIILVYAIKKTNVLNKFIINEN